VTRLGVPYVMMHMRGDPATMTSLAKYGKDVVSRVLILRD
jgi:dihydropteroate synthase